MMSTTAVIATRTISLVRSDSPRDLFMFFPSLYTNSTSEALDAILLTISSK